MYCKHCGKEIDPDSKYCSYCGSKQSDKLLFTERQESPLNPATHNFNVELSFGKSNKTESPHQKVVIEKYDKSYEGDQQAAVLGISVMVFSLFVYFLLRFENETDLALYQALGAVINLIYRIIATIIVINIAKEQNRTPKGWGIFAFILPNPALIIIGFSKKLLNKSTGSKGNDIIFSENQEVSIKNYEYGKTTYIIKEIHKTKNFWVGEREELSIEFSDGKVGKVFAYLNGYYIKSFPANINIFYNSKESAILGLHYNLSTERISKKDRI